MLLQVLWKSPRYIPLPLSSFRWLPVILSTPWLVDVLLQCLSSWSCASTLTLLVRTPVIGFKNQASLVAQMAENLPAMQETQVRSLVRKIPWRREWQPTPVLLPGEFHGQRSLVGYSPWGRKRVRHDWAINTFSCFQSWSRLGEVVVLRLFSLVYLYLWYFIQYF